MERDNDIINDYRNGMAPKDIADAHHLSLTRTYVILRKYPDYKRYERRTVSCYTERKTLVTWLFRTILQTSFTMPLKIP